MGKYLKYAIGEILLVVIGILIALQINNWNENRISQAKSKEYYQRIVEDLDFMTSVLQKGIKRREIIRKHIASAARILKYGELTKKNNDTIEFAVNAYYQFNGIEPTLNSIEELKSSGQFGLIKDKDLRQVLSDYTTYLSSISNIFNIIKKELSDNEVIEQYIFNDVREHYEDNKINYNFKELQNDYKAINKLSRTALNWQASVDFSQILLKKTKDLKRDVLKHMKPND